MDTDNHSHPALLSLISRRRKLALFLKHAPARARVLEVGSGEGWLTCSLRGHGMTVVSMDLNPPADIIGDVNAWRSLGLEPHSFDAVVALEVIEHVDCLKSLTELCKCGGLIMLSSPHPRWDWTMKILEGLRLTQRRTSAHDHLLDFSTIPLKRVALKRPLAIHQVGLFVNTASPPSRARS